MDGISRRPVLICIDVQGAFVPTDDEGPASAVLANIRALVAAARGAGVPVIFTQEVHKRSLIDIGRELDGSEGVHCLEGDPETGLLLRPRREEYVIRKRRYSAFFGTDLDIVLNGFRAGTLILAGGLTDVCVHLTAADAHQRDYRFRVVTDAVVGSSPAAHRAAVEAMRYLQRDAPLTTRAVLERLGRLGPRPTLRRTATARREPDDR